MGAPSGLAPGGDSLPPLLASPLLGRLLWGVVASGGEVTIILRGDMKPPIMTSGFRDLSSLSSVNAPT